MVTSGCTRTVTPSGTTPQDGPWTCTSTNRELHSPPRHHTLFDIDTLRFIETQRNIPTRVLPGAIMTERASTPPAQQGPRSSAAASPPTPNVTRRIVNALHPLVYSCPKTCIVGRESPARKSDSRPTRSRAASQGDGTGDHQVGIRFRPDRRRTHYKACQRQAAVQ